eukprot:TRINITY_DN16774_c0_g1_i1.p1 TRINITY_DN16774_c0_g1~~TRINITY_DN16774_c0_g1_i1.p1  ORF type:complete len:804 (-),score=232.05 TRINITY_DN16774_c0_g1_i1:75-2486(-)
MNGNGSRPMSASKRFESKETANTSKPRSLITPRSARMKADALDLTRKAHKANQPTNTMLVLPDEKPSMIPSFRNSARSNSIGNIQMNSSRSQNNSNDNQKQKDPRTFITGLKTPTPTPNIVSNIPRSTNNSSFAKLRSNSDRNVGAVDKRNATNSKQKRPTPNIKRKSSKDNNNTNDTKDKRLEQKLSEKRKQKMRESKRNNNSRRSVDKTDVNEENSNQTISKSESLDLESNKLIEELGNITLGEPLPSIDKLDDQIEKLKEMQNATRAELEGCMDNISKVKDEAEEKLRRGIARIKKNDEHLRQRLSETKELAEEVRQICSELQRIKSLRGEGYSLYNIVLDKIKPKKPKGSSRRASSHEVRHRRNRPSSKQNQRAGSSNNKNINNNNNTTIIEENNDENNDSQGGALITQLMENKTSNQEPLITSPDRTHHQMRKTKSSAILPPKSKSTVDRNKELAIKGKQSALTEDDEKRIAELMADVNLDGDNDNLDGDGKHISEEERLANEEREKQLNTFGSIEEVEKLSKLDEQLSSIKNASSQTAWMTSGTLFSQIGLDSEKIEFASESVNAHNLKKKGRSLRDPVLFAKSQERVQTEILRKLNAALQEFSNPSPTTPGSFGGVLDSRSVESRMSTVSALRPVGRAEIKRQIADATSTVDEIAPKESINELLASIANMKSEVLSNPSRLSTLPTFPISEDGSSLIGEKLLSESEHSDDDDNDEYKLQENAEELQNLEKHIESKLAYQKSKSNLQSRPDSASTAVTRGNSRLFAAAVSEHIIEDDVLAEVIPGAMSLFATLDINE